jgi:hypothetical protein
VNFATLRNDGVKQWEGNARTFPALTIVSRGDKPAAAGPQFDGGWSSTAENEKGLGFEASARSERR